MGDLQGSLVAKLLSPAVYNRQSNELAENQLN